MIKDFELVKSQLTELAIVVNSFKSEAVQLRVLELLFTLADNNSSVDEDSGIAASSTKRRKPKNKSIAKPAKESEKDIKPAKPSKSKASGSPMDTLKQLVSNGYFDTPKGIGEIVKHCKDKLGKSYPANVLSPPLLRAVQDNLLSRDRDAETKQYSYTKP